MQNNYAKCIRNVINVYKTNLLTRIFGTRYREKEWKKRNVQDALNGYWSTRDSPHRKYLVDIIREYNPSTILEIGSNCGPNLYQLSKIFPNAEIIGTEINPEAVNIGNELFKKEGIKNVTLIISKAEELSQFQNNYFDVVFSWAVLLLIGPDKIEKVMNELIRVTRKTLILLEPHIEEDKRNGLGILHKKYWMRNYICLVKKIVGNIRDSSINISKIPPDIWNPGCGNAKLLILLSLIFPTIFFTKHI